MPQTLHHNRQNKTTFFPRLWQYQRERFPLATHGLVICAFAFSGVALSAALRESNTLPGFPQVAVAAITAFILFFQLRVADEFKDHAEDCLYRPYLPVPRGLVSLPELALVVFAGAVLQIILSLALSPMLLALLILAWTYMGLMSAEFGARAWLRRHPVWYLGLHMLIMPFIDIYITACDWLPAGKAPPAGLLVFLVVSYFNGLVIELGRKTRTKDQEEPGYQTYSSLWGQASASRVWLAAIIVSAVLCLSTSLLTGAIALTSAVLALTLTLSISAQRHMAANNPHATEKLGAVSGIWKLSTYLALGTLPYATRVLSCLAH